MRLSSGDRLFPVHGLCPRVRRERWGNGCRRRRELPDPRSGRGPHPRDGRRARMPGRLDPSSAAVDLEVDEAAGKATVPRAPDLGGECVRPPDSAPYLDPSFQNTAPPSQPAQHNEDTRFPLLFWTLYPLWTLLYYFCLIKASPRPDATPTVSVVCSSRHTGGECGQAEPRQRSWATPMTSSPLARRNSWKPALGRRNDGDGLPATLGVSDVSFIVIYPVVGWGCRLKPGFSVPVPARCERESCPERNPCPAHSDRWSLVEEGSTPAWAAAGWRGCRLGGGMWRVSCLPPNYQHSPSLNRRPSPGSRREWVCERGGAL